MQQAAPGEQPAVIGKQPPPAREDHHRDAAHHAAPDHGHGRAHFRQRPFHGCIGAGDDDIGHQNNADAAQGLGPGRHTERGFRRLSHAKGSVWRLGLAWPRQGRPRGAARARVMAIACLLGAVSAQMEAYASQIRRS